MFSIDTVTEHWGIKQYASHRQSLNEIGIFGDDLLTDRQALWLW